MGWNDKLIRRDKDGKKIDPVRPLIYPPDERQPLLEESGPLDPKVVTEVLSNALANGKKAIRCDAFHKHTPLDLSPEPPVGNSDVYYENGGVLGQMRSDILKINPPTEKEFFELNGLMYTEGTFSHTFCNLSAEALAIIKVWRVGKKITLKVMADKLGMTQGNYYKIENGKRGMDIALLQKILDILDLKAVVINGKKEI